MDLKAWDDLQEALKGNVYRHYGSGDAYMIAHIYGPDNLLIDAYNLTQRRPESLSFNHFGFMWKILTKKDALTKKENSVLIELMGKEDIFNEIRSQLAKQNKNN